MDYDAIKAGLSRAVPMNGHLGLELLELGDGRGVVRLPDDPRMLNHVGSQHAAGLFAAAEFASGAAMTGALASHLANATPLAASASIQYKKLAKGPILATARLAETGAAIAERLTADGRAEFLAEIVVLQEGAFGFGSTANVRPKGFRESELRVTEFSPQSFTWAGSGGPGLRVSFAHVIEPSAGGSRVTLSIASTGPSALLLGWLAARMAKSSINIEAESLKRRAEQIAQGS